MNLVIEIAVLAGIVLLAISVHPTLKICRNDGQPGWVALLVLIVLFMVGYSAFLWLVSHKTATQLDLMITGILLGGAGFVMLVTRMSLATVTKAQRLALEEAYNAAHDSLTQLPNRKQFFAQIDQVLTDPNARGAVLMFDLDRFKEINDTLGHAIGDKVLVEVANRFADTINGEFMLSRLGGDEFALVMPGADEAKAETVCERLANSLEPIICTQDYSLTVDMSAGIALYPENGAERHTLLKRADVAMYYAKRTRKPFALYDSEVDEYSVRRLQMIPKVKQAIEQNQFVLNYQPIVSVTDNALYGVEALLRWNDPEEGLVMPDEFIPILEETNCIRDVTRWVIQRSLVDAKAWCAKYPELKIHINLSAIDAQDLTLPADVVQFAKSAGLPAASLQFEITESAMLTDVERVKQVIEEFHKLGIGVSVDDFGTGFSSLTLLRNLSLDSIKIDRSFVIGMESDQSNASIVSATIALAHSVGRGAIAEGVETEAVAKLLRQMNCDQIQGYGIGRPMAAEQVDQLLSSWDPARAESVDASSGLVAN